MPIQCFSPTMDTLPPFDPPLYAELRDWWKKHPSADVRRLILEVQTLRYAISEMRTLAEDARRQATEEAPELLYNGRALPKLHRRLENELRRCGRVYAPHKLSPEEEKRIRVPSRRHD